MVHFHFSVCFFSLSFLLSFMIHLCFFKNIFVCHLCPDYERVISHHIQGEDYQAALEVLKKTSKKELFYKFSPVLMQHIPKELVTAWIIQDHSLDPKKLIPALVQYKHNDATGQVKNPTALKEMSVIDLLVESEKSCLSIGRK